MWLRNEGTCVESEGVEMERLTAWGLSEGLWVEKIEIKLVQQLSGTL